MNLTLFIDANGQCREHMGALARFALRHECCELFIYGDRGAAIPVRATLGDILGETGEVVISSRITAGRHSEAGFMMGAGVARWIEQRMRQRIIGRCLVISRRAGAEVLSEMVRGLTGHEAFWLAMPTEDKLAEIAGGHQSIGDALSSIAHRAVRHRRAPLSVHEFSSLAEKAFPRLNDPEARLELFGHRRYKNVCRAIGIEVKAGRLVLPIPRVEPLP